MSDVENNTGKMESPDTSTNTSADGAGNETSPQMSDHKKQAFDRLFPDEYYQWSGQNIELSFDYDEFLKNAKTITKPSDFYDKDNGMDFVCYPSRNPGLIEPDELVSIEESINRGEAGKLWKQCRKSGSSNLANSHDRAGGQGLKALNRPDSLFESSITSDKGKIHLALPKLADPTAPVLTGTAALFRLMALTGRGPIIQVPLVHSGFWVSLRAPSNDILVNMYEQIAQEKIPLGRNTHGLIFSSLSSYTCRIILEVLKDHIHDTTAQLEADQNIFDLIKITDIDMLLIGWARIIWPRGFNLIRTEMSVEGASTGKLISGNVDLSRMIHYDTKAMTPWQKNHLAERGSRSMSIDTIKRYQEEVSVWKGRNIQYNDAVAVELTVPSISDYFSSSERWINGIVELVESTLTFDGVDELKNQKLRIQAQANIARQYTHWVGKVILGEQIVVDPTTIDDLINSLNSDPDFSDKFNKAISEYRDDIAVAVVGIPEPNFKEVRPGKWNARIIPIDPLSHFFNLLASLVMRLSGPQKG